MAKRKLKADVDSLLRLEHYDPISLEDIVDNEDINYSMAINDDQAGSLVKQCYKNLKSCHAVIREKVCIFWLTIIALSIVAFVGIGTYLYISFYDRLVADGIVFLPLMVILLVTLGFLAILVFMLHRNRKLFDIYFFKVKNKNIVFYMNKRYSIYYRNRKEIVCIKNKNFTEKDYGYDDFMNVKLGFNRMIGEMIIKESSDFFKIKTTQFKRNGTAQFSGNSVLWLKKDSLFPIKMLTANQYIYNFKEINDDAMHLRLPKKLLDVCNERDIPFPVDEKRIELV